MNAAPQDMTGKGKGFVKRHYHMRIGGLGLGFFCVGSVFVQQQRGLALWGLLALYAFVWPHVARRAALACKVPYHGELTNLMVDSVFGGLWVAAMHMNVLPSVLIVAMLGMNNVASGGLRLFGRGAVAHAVGFAAGFVMFGFAFEPVSSMQTVLACMPFLVIYPVALGWSTYRLAQKLGVQTRTLEYLSRTDGLTGLLNRRTWETVLAEEFERCRANGYASSLLLIDLDHFKLINDTRGHQAGDAVLQSFAVLLREVCRDTDPIGRYGGEEFGIVLPGATLTEAHALAERLVAAVRERASSSGLGSVYTISVGVAQCERAMRDHHAWLKRADASLYEAKLGGRDRVVAAGAPALPLPPQGV